MACTVRGTTQHADEGLHVTHDTLTIDLPGRLGPVIWHEQKYYCFIETNNPYSSQWFMDFYILSSTGEVEEKIEVPEEMNVTYYDLHLRNDSVLTKLYMDEGTYYLDPQDLQWVRTKQVDDVVFENAKFHLNYLDFGEWGGILWFKDKQTGIEYELGATTPSINVINDTFYVSTDGVVYRIADPTKLSQCAPTNYYGQTVAENDIYGRYSRQGAEVLYMDSSMYEEPHIQIVTSFTSHDTLYLLCNENNSAYVGVLKDGQIEKRNTISEEMTVYHSWFQYRSSGSDRRSQVFKFGRERKVQGGLIDIDGGAVMVHHLHNVNSVRILGTEAADISFRDLLDHQLDNGSTLNLTDMAPLAKARGGIDVSPKHIVGIGEGYYPNPKGFILETPRVYKVIEDSVITLLMEHFYTKSDGSIKVSMYNWKETNEVDHGIFPSKHEGHIKHRFKDRFDRLVEYLTTKLGTPHSSSAKENDRQVNWSTDCGMKVGVSGLFLDNYQTIRLWVYSQN